jgi:threonine dehydrogenase-like Zn-dependent dehydrogenase
MAQQGGATAVIDSPVENCREEVLKATGGKLPRVVNDSTGNAAVFSAALGLADRFGKVVILGDTGAPASQHLTGDVITRGLTIVGAHDGHNDDKWNNASITRLLFSLAISGRFNLNGLVTDVFLPDQAKLAYEAANTRRGETMGIEFDWTKE